VEQRVRRRAVDFVSQLRQPGLTGLSAGAVARQIGVSARTVRHWTANDDGGNSVAIRRGRRPLSCSVAQRNEVVRFLREVSGPAVGLAALRALFVPVPRCVLEDLLRRYRHVWRYRYQQKGFRLTWQRAGSVWAIDFSKPTHLIDGIYDCLFAVRDLGSHRQLAWHPFTSETAQEAIRVLDDLFRRFGPPLVIKSDNGSAFIAEIFGDLLRSWGVWHLLSPPRHPQYNGALERSNGTLKTFTHQRAMLEGHAFRWTSHNVEYAMQLANTLSRPWGHRGPSPEEVWEQRATITAEEREEFQRTVLRNRPQARGELGLDELLELNRDHRARIDRVAVSQGLQELGYLTMYRVPRPPRKARRLSRGDLFVRGLRHQACAVPRLTYQPRVAPDSPAPQAAPVEPSNGARQAAVTETSPAVTVPTGECPSPPADAALGIDRAPIAPDASAPSDPGLNAPLSPTTLPSGSVMTAGSGDLRPAPREKGLVSLAKQCARDTMREQAGVAVISPMLSPPETTHGEGSHTSWWRRPIALIVRIAKAAKISWV
jgi:transposase InsO family protein